MVAALHVAAPDLVVASHLHHPAHLQRARQLGVPSLTVLRDPVDSCTSLAIYTGQVPSDALMERWLSFHRALAELTDVAVIRFEDVVADVGAVVTWAVSHARRSVAVSDITDIDQRAAEEVDALTLRRFGRIEPLRVSRPDAERERSKAESRLAFDTLDPALRRACDDTYRMLLERAVPFRQRG